MPFQLIPSRNPVSLYSFLFFVSSAVMKRYLGALNQKEHIRSTTSTCGSFVISGSEDGTAYVWNTETGKGSSLLLLQIDKGECCWGNVSRK